jgi:septal ring factor EnvC (AmiA/AmiB activator)
MHNETGLTLERGPVTVLEEGAYAGEAVVPFTRADAELIVPFAVELGIKVEEKRDSERQLVGISIRHGYLHLQEFDVQHTTYHLTSTLSQAVDVTIEHARRSAYELADTPEPAEQSASFARWQVACATSTRTVFSVHERRLVSRREEVRSLTGQRLQRYLQDKLLDAATVRALEEVLNVYRQVNETQQQVKRVQQERESIYKQQKQIHGNLGPLSQQGEEGKLRARYVSELNRLEDQLKNLETEEQRLKQRIEELERQAQAKLQALSTER